MQNDYPAAEFLLVDTDPKVSEFLAAYLSERGHPCNASPEADKALDWLGQNRCEVVVVDLKSQNGTATTLIASVRAIDSRLPIVVFTEKGCNEVQVRDRNTFSPERTRGLLFQQIPSRHNQIKFLSVFARESLDNRVGRLSGPGIKNLDAVRLGLLSSGGSLAIEDHDNANTGVILV